MPKLLDKIQTWVGKQPIIVQLGILFVSTFIVIALLISAFNGA
jgi:hypothetical protein